MFQKVLKTLGIDPQKREIERLSAIVEQINKLEPKFASLSDEELRGMTTEFRARISDRLEDIEDEKERQRAEQEALDDILPEAFAAVREASKRHLGLRHYDVQMIGGMVLHQNKIAEMRTGEGKTLVATLPLYLNALLGRGAHLVTVNDYLARRDARWMGPVYIALGMTVGVLQMAAKTENGRNAYLVNLEKVSIQEDEHQLLLVPRREAYQADITYGTNSEFGFDYLRDNLTLRLSDRVQRGHYYAIVDEVDNILIDEARTPLIISGPAQDDSESYVQMAQVVRQLRPEDYEINEKDRSVSLTELGDAHVEEILQIPLRDPDRPEDVTPEQARLYGHLEQALRAQLLYKRNKDYLVQNGKVVIVDEFTGRLMPGRRWSDGLHQAVEAKEGVKVEAENVTYATITIQNYFRMYQKLAGMSGTAVTESEEFYKIYKLDVVAIPTNLEYRAARKDSEYVAVDAKDEDGYRYSYYARKDEPSRAPIYFRRKDYPDVVYRSEEAKLRAITQEIIQFHIIGRPQLVGTTSVEHSERLADRLGADMVRRLAQVMLIRDLFIEMKKIEISERAIPELQPLYRPLDRLETAELRNLARALSINMSFNVEEPQNISRLLTILGLGEESGGRLIKVLQAGVPHQVLNARKHDEESMIIAKAGAFGAVTIATNMAGRGVDIKLGGELDEEILGAANRVLARAGHDAFNMNNEQRSVELQKLLEDANREMARAGINAGGMTNEDRRQALKKTRPEIAGIYSDEIEAFLRYMVEMKQVRQLGGLHVVGSERHEARRIDNQLRGRASRQGDPGSSRFFLALEDDLMRLFGGGQVEGLLQRLSIDESLPIESGIVGKLVEQSQTRVEGSNFDVRKHLLEYDDVLNAQRKRIYEQRDRIFVKEDLSEDISEMLRTELNQRIPQALKDEEGPWKLVAYLDDIQPPILYEEVIYPSFSLSLLIDSLVQGRQKQDSTVSHLRAELLNLAGKTLTTEREHMLNSFRQLIDRSEETLETNRQERYEALDNFIDSFGERGEDGQPVTVQSVSEELAGLIRLPQFRLTNEQMRLLNNDPEEIRGQLREAIDDYLLTVTVSRLVGAFERRLGEPLNVRPNQFSGVDWAEVANSLLDETERVLDRQYDRLLGSGGQIARDLDPHLDKLSEYASDDATLMNLLLVMAEGMRLVFDRRSHRQAMQRTRRLNYAFLAGQMLQDRGGDEVSQMVLDQFEGAQEALRAAWGRYEWQRLAQNNITLEQLEERLRTRLEAAMGTEVFTQVCSQPLDTLGEAEKQSVMDMFGWFDQNEAARHLLLSVISELWVDYLTRVEALRVSIGLEAYAQRDPLVQYKGRASEMFQTLLGDVRMGVISRMFTFRPRQPVSTVASSAPAAGGDGDGAGQPQLSGGKQQAAQQAVTKQPVGAKQATGAPEPSNKKKRKRH